MIAAVVAVVDQTFPVVADDVKTTEPPVQKEVLPLAEIVGIVGKAFTVTAISTLLLSSPLALIWLT